jgi:hypothetical protein
LNRKLGGSTDDLDAVEKRGLVLAQTTISQGMRRHLTFINAALATHASSAEADFIPWYVYKELNLRKKDSFL